MIENYTAYIDEAGDEGITKLRDADGPGGQSLWLVLGGIIVRQEVDRELPRWRDQILEAFRFKRRDELHFRNLKHDQKVAAATMLAGKRMGICCVCSNKVTILDSPSVTAVYSQKGHLYNYLTRFLLERLTSVIASAAERSGNQARLSIVFSRRANTDYHAMREYFELMRDGREKIKPIRGIDWSVFSPDDIRVENHSKWAGLQLADIATSAMFNALEPNRFGHIEPRYALSLKNNFIRHKSSLLDCGLTLVPRLGQCRLTDDQRQFVEAMCERSGGSPAPDTTSSDAAAARATRG